MSRHWHFNTLLTWQPLVFLFSNVVIHSSAKYLARYYCFWLVEQWFQLFVIKFPIRIRNNSCLRNFLKGNFFAKGNCVIWQLKIVIPFRKDTRCRQYFTVKPARKFSIHTERNNNRMKLRHKACRVVNCYFFDILYDLHISL